MKPNPVTIISSNHRDQQSYFEVDENQPLKNCYEHHEVKSLSRRNTSYQSPADFCHSSDNYRNTDVNFVCELEDCREITEDFYEEIKGDYPQEDFVSTGAGTLWCPKLKIFNCGAFECVDNRSKRDYEEFKDKTIAAEASRLEHSNREIEQEIQTNFNLHPFAISPTF